nr:hypothetical protein L203_05815 [Cryptococcus depauperatus CBS 7841]
MIAALPTPSGTMQSGQLSTPGPVSTAPMATASNTYAENTSVTKELQDLDNTILENMSKRKGTHIRTKEELAEDNKLQEQPYKPII